MCPLAYVELLHKSNWLIPKARFHSMVVRYVRTPIGALRLPTFSRCARTRLSTSALNRIRPSPE